MRKLQATIRGYDWSFANDLNWEDIALEKMIQNELEEGNTSLNGSIDKKIVKVKYTITNDGVAILLAFTYIFL